MTILVEESEDEVADTVGGSAAGATPADEVFHLQLAHVVWDVTDAVVARVSQMLVDEDVPVHTKASQSSSKGKKPVKEPKEKEGGHAVSCPFPFPVSSSLTWSSA